MIIFITTKITKDLCVRSQLFVFLCRFSELFVYGCRMLVARSVAETPSVRRSNIYEFMFGYNYGLFTHDHMHMFVVFFMV